MNKIKITEYGDNITINKQIARGKRSNEFFVSEDFRTENRISLDITNIFNAPGENAIKKSDVEALIPDVINAHKMLKENKGDILDGNIPMTGWIDLPINITKEHIEKINSLTERLSQDIDAFVSLGIGGSYLGIEATIRALTHNYFNQLKREERGKAPEIYFLGQNMDPDYFRDTLDMLDGKRIAVNVISKSGTTTETAVAFRIIRRLMEKNMGKDGDKLIIATTDKSRGALKNLAEKKVLHVDRTRQPFIYSPAVGKDSVQRQRVSHLLHTVFDGRVEDLILHLVEETDLSPEDLHRIETKIKNREKEDGNRESTRPDKETSS